MNVVESRQVQCPYCGETIDIQIDCSVMNQSYIEDCEVCCRPINFTVSMEQDGGLTVLASHEND